MAPTKTILHFPTAIMAYCGTQNAIFGELLCDFLQDKISGFCEAGVRFSTLPNPVYARLNSGFDKVTTLQKRSSYFTKKK
jgi:hypothetical protein